MIFKRLCSICLGLIEGSWFLFFIRIICIFVGIVLNNVLVSYVLIIDILLMIKSLFFNFFVLIEGVFFCLFSLSKWWIVLVGRFVVLFICLVVWLVGVVSRIGKIFWVYFDGFNFRLFNFVKRLMILLIIVVFFVFGFFVKINRGEWMVLVIVCFCEGLYCILNIFLICWIFFCIFFLG